MVSILNTVVFPYSKQMEVDSFSTFSLTAFTYATLQCFPVHSLSIGHILKMYSDSVIENVKCHC